MSSTQINLYAVTSDPSFSPSMTRRMLPLIHLNHIPEKLHVEKLDPWISYVFVVLLAIAVRKWVEHPCQVAIGGWWKRKRAAQKELAY